MENTDINANKIAILEEKKEGQEDSIIDVKTLREYFSKIRDKQKEETLEQQVGQKATEEDQKDITDKKLKEYCSKLSDEQKKSLLEYGLPDSLDTFKKVYASEENKMSNHTKNI